MFKEGDTLRFRLAEMKTKGDGKTKESGTLCLDFIFGNQLVHQEPLPHDFRLPLQPLCTLPDDCFLEVIP